MCRADSTCLRLLIGCLPLGFLAGISACTVVVPGDPTSTPAPTDLHPIPLTFARHLDQAFSDSDVDDVLATANTLMQTVQSTCPDVACPVEFQRDGSVGTFSTGLAYVTSESQLDAIFAEPEDFKIVSMMIGVCGASGPGEAGEVLGCSYTNGSVVIVYDATPDVWAHEWGHVVGLDHRDDCITNVMHSWAPDTDAVNESECAAFLMSRSIIPLIGFARVHEPEATGEPDWGEVAPAAGETTGAWLERLAASRFVQPIPESAVAPYLDGGSVADLLAVVESGDTDVVRATGIRLLGFSRDPRAVAPLIGLLEALPCEVGTRDVAIAGEALLALGRIADGDPTGAAMGFLTDRADPAAWSADGISICGSAGEPDSSAAALARVAVLALSLSHDPTVRARLEQLQSDVQAGVVCGPWLEQQVEEALLRLDGQDPAAGRAVRQWRRP